MVTLSLISSPRTLLKCMLSLQTFPSTLRNAQFVTVDEDWNVCIQKRIMISIEQSIHDVSINRKKMVMLSIILAWWRDIWTCSISGMHEVYKGIRDLHQPWEMNQSTTQVSINRKVTSVHSLKGAIRMGQLMEIVLYPDIELLISTNRTGNPMFPANEPSPDETDRHPPLRPLAI